MPTPRIFQINASAGGVPKLALLTAEVTPDGLTVDKQSDLKHHGGPNRALCLFSLERILDLQAEGHPIFPGAAGENLTLTGVDWDAVAPGVKLRLGVDVLIEIVSYTEPCAAIKPFFRNGKPKRIWQEMNPGWSRVYARVLRAGRIGVGDEVSLVAK